MYVSIACVCNLSCVPCAPASACPAARASACRASGCVSILQRHIEVRWGEVG